MKLAKSIQDIQQPTDRELSRQGNYDLLKAFEAFELGVFDVDGTSGDIQSQINGEYNINTGKKDGGIFGGKSFYEMVSAPMLLARLVSAGCPVQVQGQDAYKVTWYVSIKHKKTGRIVTFYDWKGASSIGSDQGEDTKQFIKDVQALVLALADAQFPHPYDGCVVGEIA